MTMTTTETHHASYVSTINERLTETTGGIRGFHFFSYGGVSARLGQTRLLIVLLALRSRRDVQRSLRHPLDLGSDAFLGRHQERPGVAGWRELELLVG